MLRRTSEAPDAAASPRGLGAPYRIGVGLELNEDGMAVSFLSPGGPGERDGLQPGDIIISINHTPLGADPIVILDEVLSSPAPIHFGIRRGEESLEVVVTPQRVER